MKDLGKLIFKFLWKNIAKSKMYIWDEKKRKYLTYHIQKCGMKLTTIWH